MSLSQRNLSVLPAAAFPILVILIPASPVQAGSYLLSAHGDSANGVSRTSTAALGYAQGNCAHCHEPHASIQGSEPAPADGSPSSFLLFTTPFTNQSTSLCFDCHVDTGSRQTGGAITNRSYAYRAGGWTSDTLNDVQESFAFTSPGSSHNLSDIQTFIASQSWGYAADANPCVACHNPHAAQGDPENAPNAAKSSTTRGWLISLPSQHGGNPWPLWGDDASERMNSYTSAYQAPYRFGSTSTYEPDGSTTQDGANLTDFVTFCTDCHNATNTIYSTNLGRNLRQIDWANEKHGLGSADEYIDMLPPYTAGSGSLGYVLSCLDCHEPHGSSNPYLLRQEVNGGALAGAITTTTGSTFSYLCERCHDNTTNTWQDIHHFTNDSAYARRACSTCHGGYPQDCSRCHYHGAITGSGGVNQTDYSPFNRRTF